MESAPVSCGVLADMAEDAGYATALRTMRTTGAAQDAIIRDCEYKLMCFASGAGATPALTDFLVSITALQDRDDRFAVPQQLLTQWASYGKL